MQGAIFICLVLTAVICAVKVGRDAMVPKCRVCHKPRARDAERCLHCGAH
jgi:hypothetical protein